MPFNRQRFCDKSRRKLSCEPLESRSLLAADFPQFIDPHPSVGNQFGRSVVPLSTGNVVVTAPLDDAGGTDAGAAYLFNGASGALISTLTGTTPGDRIGSNGAIPLANGNYLILSEGWDNGAATDAGAVTFGDGVSGEGGVVSCANSLVGTTTNDRIGTAITVLNNGNYLVRSTLWDNGAMEDAGAVTFGSGDGGIVGAVSGANSLIGGAAHDNVGTSAALLTNGNYVICSPGWHNGATSNAGAATFAKGDIGISGVVSSLNSLVGSTANDSVGGSGVTTLRNGSYVVRSSSWNNGTAFSAGAVTWGDGEDGIIGVVSAANSLIGSSSNDRVGESGVTALGNGNYVVLSPFWDNGAVVDAGAATFGNGDVGITGPINIGTSLIGTAASDQVGSRGVTTLTNGNYVVLSSSWDNGALIDAGAATFSTGVSGISGTINAGNSLVGSTANDSVGNAGASALINGNYVVHSPYWSNGTVAYAGASTLGNGVSGVSGSIDAGNSLVGSTSGDEVGFGGAIPLKNGNYVVLSPFWDNGPATDAGAATFANGTTGVTGTLNLSNSLIGGNIDDRVGRYGGLALANGNYLVFSPDWDRGPATDAGAVTFGRGSSGISGLVSSANSLVGSTAGDLVGNAGAVELTNSSYVVRSPNWSNGAATNAGAATFGNGASGISGPVSPTNSLVGGTANDSVSNGGIFKLSTGNYVVYSRSWANGGSISAGAVTFGRGTGGVRGTINSFNSAIGEAANSGLQLGAVSDDRNLTFVGRFMNEAGGVVRVGSQIDGFNAAPVVANFGGTKTYTENGAAILVSTTATVNDIDSPNFFTGELRISFKTGGTAADRLRIRTEGTDTGQINLQGRQVRFGTIVLGTLNGGVGTAPLVVELTNQATTFRVRQLLRNVTFFNVSDNPATAPRTVRVTLSDGDGETSAAVFKMINVTAVNDKPVLSLSGAIGYVHDKPAITLAPFSSVSDVDSANFSGGRLRVRITDGTSSSNRLAIGPGFTIDANNNVLHNGIVIGKRASNGFGTSELIVTFNTKATPFVVQQLVRAITFKTVGGAAGQRKVVFTVSDGDGGVSPEATKLVNVT